MNSSNTHTPLIRIGLLALAAVLALTGCGGGGGGGSGGGPTGPAAALAVTVDPGSSNPADTINAANASNVDVTVTLPPESQSTDNVKVTLSDGLGTESSAQGQGSGVTGGGNVVITVDASGLADGQIDVRVETNGGSAQSQFVAALTKDTVPPAMPSSVAPLDPQGVLSQWVNLATSPAAIMRALLGTAQSEQGTAQLFVRVDPLEISTPVQPFANAAFDFAPLDLTTLPDGTLDLEVVLTDVAGNSASAFFQTSKDTVAPQGPSLAQVASGPSNPVNMINGATVSAVAASMTFGPDVEGRDVHVTLTDGLLTVASDPTAVPLAGGTVAVGGMDTTAFADGPVSLTAIVVDPAGNPTTFYGIQATKDVAGPIGPSSAAVAAGPSNPGGIINLASVSGVQVDVVFPIGATATDTATVTLSTGSTTVTSAPFNIPIGGGTVSVTGMNCVGVGEGLLMLTVTASDSSGNTTVMAGTPPLKDTIPPVAPTAARVAGTVNNNPDIINIASAASVAGLVTFPATAVGDESYVFNMSDGSVTVSSATMIAPVGGGSSSLGAFNCSGMSDGFVTVSVTVTDPAQNTTAMTGTAALKDTIAPVPPIAASVDAGANNAANVINLSSAAAVSVTVTWPAGAPGTESAQVALTNGATVSAPVAQVAGGGAATVTGLSTFLLTDGSVSVSVTTTDPAGNVAAFNGTAALKDTIGPTMPVSAGVDAGAGNGANVINQTNVSSVAVSVTWPAGSPGNETAQLVLSGGASVMASVTQTIGAGVTTVTGIDTTSLSDGPVSVSVSVTDPAGNAGNFSGTAAVKGTSGPIGATAVDIPAGGSNPYNWVNLATAGAVSVQVTFPAAATGTEMVSLACTDGVVTVNAGPQPVPAGGGTVIFGGLDLSALADGALAISATVVDTMSNVTVTGSSGAAKDTLPPANPTAAQVPAGAQNPVHMINSFTVLASNVDVSWPGEAGNESMYVVLSDGISSQASLPQVLGPGAALVAFTNLDCTPLADGPVSIVVHVTDQAGNPGMYSGTSATKDTVGPTAPTSAHVVPSAGNPVDVINIASSGAVACDVTYGAGSASDVATVSLSDGIAGVSSGALSVAPGGTVSYSGIGTGSLADGPVSVTVNVIDPAGNVTAWSGTAATKDTVAPLAATAAGVAAGPGNAPGVVNAASQGAVQVDGTVPAQGSGMQVTCSLTDGSVTANGAAQAAPAAGGVVSFAGLNAATMADGALTVTVTITDAAGNPTAMNAPATKDTVAPLLLVDPTTNPTAAASQSITGESEAGAPITVTNGITTATGNASPAGRFSIAASLAPSSLNKLTVTSTDVHGNVATAEIDFAGVPLQIVHNPAAPPVAFTDVTVASGLGISGLSAGGSFQDLDGDGDLDLFIGGANTVWQNNGSGVFSNVSASSPGLSGLGANSATFGDYDNDGDLDVYVVDTAVSALFRNDTIPGGTIKLVDVTAASSAGATGTMVSGLWADLDQDGWIDLVATDNDVSGQEVRHNLANGTFAPLSLFAPAIATVHYGLAADVVNDGRPDLLFADATPSFFWRNDGALAFTDIAGATSNVSITQTTEAGGMIAADYDNDGDLDLIVAAGGALAPSASCGGCPRANNQIFINNGTSTFTDLVSGSTVALLAGIEPSDGWLDLCAGDVDNDGRLDLYAGNGGANRLFLNVGDASLGDGVWEFVEVAGACGVAGTGASQMVQMADIDGDGDLDLFTANNMTVNELYRNDVNNRRNLTVVVHGLGTGPGTASRDAIGAHVELRDAAGTTILATREISGGRGFGSQDPLRAHFGVTPSEIYTVRVTFPSGAVQTASGVVPRDAANQTITISE
jgi:hypothetical protein